MYPYDKVLNNADTSSDAGEEKRIWTHNPTNALYLLLTQNEIVC